MISFNQYAFPWDIDTAWQDEKCHAEHPVLDTVCVCGPTHEGSHVGVTDGKIVAVWDQSWGNGGATESAYDTVVNGMEVGVHLTTYNPFSLAHRTGDCEVEGLTDENYVCTWHFEGVDGGLHVPCSDRVLAFISENYLNDPSKNVLSVLEA